MRTIDPAAKTLLKPSEAAVLFDVPLPTIYFWHRMGNIHGVKINGTCLRIFTESIREFLRSRPTGDRRHRTFDPQETIRFREVS
jgi:predicted site-specific integrase-resolvase